MEKFAIGLLLGGVGGALLVANNYKMRTLVKKGQEEVQNKLNAMMDEKILAMEEKQAQEEKDEDGVSDKKPKKSAK